MGSEMSDNTNNDKAFDKELQKEIEMEMDMNSSIGSLDFGDEVKKELEEGAFENNEDTNPKVVRFFPTTELIDSKDEEPSKSSIPVYCIGFFIFLISFVLVYIGIVRLINNPN